ncbi:MAG: hypothetical protein ACOCVD_03425 [Bacillota bacterium]
MSKKNRTGKTDDIFKNIGERMKKNRQSKEETDPPEEEVTEEETESTDTEPVEDKTTEKNNEEPKSDSWSEEQSYRSSFIVTGEMEDNFESCRRKFRKNLRSNLSKQSAIELGWQLLSQLDQKYFEEVKATHSPEEDLVEALKNIIEEHF